MILLIDGFDEIFSSYGEEVLELVNSIRNESGESTDSGPRESITPFTPSYGPGLNIKVLAVVNLSFPH